jgi:DNA topoisomerase-1
VCAVSERLGNTPAVCRKSYVHPYLLEAYGDPRAWAAWRRTTRGRSRTGLSPSESRLLRFLETAAPARRAA